MTPQEAIQIIAEVMGEPEVNFFHRFADIRQIILHTEFDRAPLSENAKDWLAGR